METPSFVKSKLTALIIPLSLIAACTTTGPRNSSFEAPVEQAAPPLPPTPAAPPFHSPPPLTEESWELPSFTGDAPLFPYLPDEDRSLSRSVGQVTTGFLVNGRPLPLPHPNMAILPRQFARYLQYTSQTMIDLLEDAVAYLAAEDPEAVLYLGNLGRPQGGDIPYSVSHTNGRDADLAFFVVDESGEPVAPPDLLPLDENGIFDGANLEETDYPELFLRFDAPRNWRLIEGLLQSEAAHIQYIFVSNPLRRLLLEEGRRQGASAATLRLARQILVQPGGALPHDDHFHLRIHCSPLDLASGCQERGRPGPTYRPDHTQARQTIAAAAPYLAHEHPFWRQTALRRLALFENHGLFEQIRGLLNDPEPSVRIAAIRALEPDPAATAALTSALHEEEHPQVFAELVVALSHRGPQAFEPLLAALQRDLPIERGPAGTISTMAITARALARQERPESVPHLIDALTRANPQTRPQINYALEMLTNHELPAPGAKAWQAWWEEHRELAREEWLILGFQSAGFSVQSLGPEAVWELCRAITAKPYLNFNAQRSLMRLSGRTPASLTWHPHDASFYWRRYFEERQDRLSIPPIPAELTTAGGYTRPED